MTGGDCIMVCFVIRSILLSKYYLCYEIKKNEMGRACDTYGVVVHSGFWCGNLRERASC